MKELKGFLAGMLVAALFFNPLALSAGALAESIMVYVNKVNININGVPQKIDNFIYNNTTYVPLKAITTALGKELVWDSKTNTAHINDRNIVPKKRGNSIGNITNGSLVAAEGEWVYYVNFEDDNKIYRMKKDGSDKTKIYDNFTGALNVVDGWLYFTSRDDDGFLENLYKMKTDGTGRIELSKDDATYINVVNDWIYYSNIDDGKRMYKMKIDGSCRTKLNDDPSVCLIVHDGWIYYYIYDGLGAAEEDQNDLFKIRIDGSGRTKISEDLTSKINIEGDWIYYINYHVYSREGISIYRPDEVYKIRKDGSEKTRVIEDDVKLMNVTDGWIYYTTNSQLCKAKTDGSQKLVLIDEIYRISGLYVIDEWLFYTVDAQQGFELHRMKTDGTDKEQVY